MWISVEFDVLPDGRSLAGGSWSVTRPLVAELQRKFSVSPPRPVRMICTGGRASVWPWCP